MNCLSRGSGAKRSSLFSLTPPGFISPTPSVLLARGRSLCPGEAGRNTIHADDLQLSWPGRSPPSPALPWPHFRPWASFSPFVQPLWAGYMGASMLDGQTDGAAKDCRRGLAVEGTGFGMDLTSSYWDFSANTNTPAEVWKSPCQHC